jgi:hypothetical protein
LALKEHDTKRASKAMISGGSVEVADRKVSVNKYSMFFDVEIPQNFKHLVYFQIRKGSHSIFSIIGDLFAEMGKVAWSYISTGEDLHCIVVLIETTAKKFQVR